MRVKNGFSLLELLIVFAIIGVLSAIGYPTYQDYLVRAHRIDGQSALIALACRMEAFHMHHKTYKTATIGTGEKNDVLSQAVTANGWYRLSIVSATDTSYLLKATPIKIHETNGASCQSLTLDNLGIEGVINGTSDVQKAPKILKTHLYLNVK